MDFWKVWFIEARREARRLDRLTAQHKESERGAPVVEAPAELETVAIAAKEEI